MDHLDVLAEKQPLIEIAAEAFAVEEIPQVLLVHGRIAVRELQAAVELPVHGHEDDDIGGEARPRPLSAPDSFPEVLRGE